MFRRSLTTVHYPEPTVMPPRPRLNFFGSRRPKYIEDGWYASTTHPDTFILCCVSKPKFGVIIGPVPNGFTFFYTFETEDDEGVNESSVFNNVFERCPPGFSITLAQPERSPS